ncbi:hypothetical protein [Bacillus piscicola]|uniref:hypothetical protein n=1 Tax=Bacillus piscicola TaxID=1632684 RepID=UPI001F08929F|nr:hypothetical protein [Bacillus piscicola]
MRTKRISLFITGLIVCFMLSGCLYPAEKKADNQVSNDAQLASVQQAIDQFKEDTGVLPIKTKEADTPIYQKYVVDFRKLIPRYIQEPPKNAFENGGVYQYVIIDPENSAETKVIDLRMMNEIQAFQLDINRYIKKHGYAPIEKPIGPEVFSVNYKQLKYDSPPKVKSPYHRGTYLPLIINQRGEVIVDYAIDLNMALEEFDSNYETGEDIRSILTDHYPIVPAFSVPYTIDENGDPQFKK